MDHKSNQIEPYIWFSLDLKTIFIKPIYFLKPVYKWINSVLNRFLTKKIVKKNSCKSISFKTTFYFLKKINFKTNFIKKTVFKTIFLKKQFYIKNNFVFF
jgi:hypothetical protein